MSDYVKENAVAEALTRPPSERKELLINYVDNYFELYGIETPMDALLDKGLISPLIDMESTEIECVQSLDLISKFADKYHQENTIRIRVDKDVTRATLFKFLKRTPYGDRIEEMGIDGSTKSNIKDGFITLPALDEIIKIYNNKRYKKTLELAFGKHTDFIFKKFMELRR